MLGVWLAAHSRHDIPFLMSQSLDIPASRPDAMVLCHALPTTMDRRYSKLQMLINISIIMCFCQAAC